MFQGAGRPRTHVKGCYEQFDDDADDEDEDDDVVDFLVQDLSHNGSWCTFVLFLQSYCMH